MIAGVGDRPGCMPGFLVALTPALVGVFILLGLLARMGAAA
ncbi:hypothetical protein [Methylocaldum sp. RMAD-M]|nr:hypothetical protein [Methylocaldum sp. RMAD-M]MBP1149999.1 putative membrane protein YphA (DoxX/SURF4 family) [Methylocaldum sp. RMAD-M]